MDLVRTHLIGLCFIFPLTAALNLYTVGPQIPEATNPSETNPVTSHEEPKKTAFEPGAVVCAKANVTAGLTTAFSFPVDFGRGSCWHYEGRSGTGKVELSPIDERSFVS